ncbi:ras guanine nucleotide exchange factor, slime mold, putative [Entamoeba invadens IP1]|uniref:Ras guanine nucleotide exchange factor, slime mold, putative n=1 Tax=Entamoeba invadens IP1 TaxID=370355 RepID=A0A0A1U4M1_ENTIV|nr:ras guanine nucleotide exchange factor, slime mold, putative [Entamoeba invadens IP1]ELP86655.1 ras guanine nucleotide exchange factor, slime mold, putative [Entamoeba invadens IP1]|eukprot:XP_004186001.1 ras guanine nucleotide exchange factor, slime mold, putative [Entamoeba invadens IP1]
MSVPSMPATMPTQPQEGVRIGRRSLKQSIISPNQPTAPRPSNLNQTTEVPQASTPQQQPKSSTPSLNPISSPTSSFNKMGSASYNTSSYKKGTHQSSIKEGEGSYTGSHDGSSHFSGTTQNPGIYPKIELQKVEDLLGALNDQNKYYFDMAEDPKVEKVEFKEKYSENDGKWREQIYKDVQTYQRVKETVYPLHRTIALVKELQPGVKKVKEKVTKENILEMILQHLHVKGYNTTRGVLETESGVKTPKHTLNKSVLLYTLFNAIHNSELVYDQIVEDKHYSAQSVNEHFTSIGLAALTHEADDSTKLYEDPDVKNMKTVGDVTLEDTNDKNMNLNSIVFRLTAVGPRAGVFVKAVGMFLTTITTPEKFFLKLMERLDVPEDFEPENGCDKNVYKSSVSSKVAAVIKTWIDLYAIYYETDEKKALVRLMEEHSKIVDGAVLNVMKGRIGILKKSIEDDHKTKGFNPMIKKNCIVFPLKKPEESSGQTKQLPDQSKLSTELFKQFFPKVRFLDIDDDVIVSQFTYMEAFIFYQIRPSEFFGQAWAKVKYRYKAQHILESTQMFNFISSFFVNLFLNTTVLEERIALAKKVLSIAIKAHAIKNYDLLYSLVGALGDSAVHRMKRTMEAVNQDPLWGQFEKLGMLFQKNYSGFRAEVKDIYSTPCIPFIGTYLTDYTFLDDGNPDMVGEKFNLDKKLRLYECINNVVRFEDTKYDIVAIPQIICYINNYYFSDGILTDEKLKYDKSLKTEPRVPKPTAPVAQ